MSNMQNLYLLVPLAPLLGAIVAGLFGKVIGRTWTHRFTILMVAVSFAASVAIFQDVLAGNTFNGPVYQWLTAGDTSIDVGFMIDQLTVMMMLVVTFVSLMVHIYTIGYMSEDKGYQRFFSYISLFTFSMLMLVMANNFMQLFFGWEAVGLVSYLLIGFWYDRPTAIYANLKAFLVNRVGDFGFLLGIGLVLMVFGTLDYQAVFDAASSHVGILAPIPGIYVDTLTAICILLFIGAMGKSAQFPLHVWLPDSMEGPTPISALIHAATMVTAGIFMVARMSPLFELSDTALSFVMVIGAITALFMGFLGIIQNDIKRVVAYSTLSQLGYMTVALGASAYSVAVFHLMTHAFFKALLFLAAGSVIIGMHHVQDIRQMGGLRKYMKITHWTFLAGSLALIGTPLLSGFYSKDSIIEAVGMSQLAGSGFAYFAVVAGVFVTAFYSFRLYFLVFHGAERFGKAEHAVHAAPKAAAQHDAHHGAAHDDDHASHEHHGLAPGEKPHETSWVVWLPLVALAIPSLFIGYFTIEPMLFGGYFDGAIVINQQAHPVMQEMQHEFHGAWAMAIHGLMTLPFWLALAGVVTAWYFYLKNPAIPAWIKQKSGFIYTLLENKYYFDRFNDWFFAAGARNTSRFLWKFGDVKLIDGFFVNGTANLIGKFSTVLRRIQTGYIYHYAFAMIIGVFVLLTIKTWFK
ncbi:MAG: NADH-quinone oxidoreductase subunit L [Gallionellales bacterium 35-53-114]|nr:MAG: NADH-quinone oxidoreductase subunit L [Gallionellales bacterium 35-53-114]OYZ62938.1 MAG: NADH-quinone oxidoreductase subunit L [Gallionellales bacterium 24-53-125]OZB10010.1 MAG: NADH-quinone oxidoreductase subunit L [Gallionellales bacterium 39-52-133]HQS58372.1 NADH-quinone oxidoreductase subunit L [Gallionellaceae bacterium]HQS73927.1 NADH-quinone oxidoreductase subunit L [Gallionellaceae bacterium]